MGLWTDIAEWVGPTVNCNKNGMVEQRGLVLHIAQGSYEGTIGWQKNPTAQVSSHFIAAKDGRLAQMVDTHDRAWTQIEGNGHWLSVENEGFVPDGLSAGQIEAAAQILARAHREYSVPLVVATSPDQRGLGHHSMGAENGVNWGHPSCPGSTIIAQKPAIVARAKEIVGGVEEDEMKTLVLVQLKGEHAVWLSDMITRRWVQDSTELAGVQSWISDKRMGNGEENGKVFVVDNLAAFGVPIGPTPEGEPIPAPDGPLTAEDVRHIVHEELSVAQWGYVPEA